MAGIELHANAVQMFDNALPAPGNTSTLLPEPAWLIFLSSCCLHADGGRRRARLCGARSCRHIVVLILFTFGMSALASFQNWVPDLFHPWLAIGLTYSGVTAYRFLYEDREKRKVTAPLRPVPEARDRRRSWPRPAAASTTSCVGGERRDISLLFVDIRGFTSMSESMAART